MDEISKYKTKNFEAAKRKHSRNIQEFEARLAWTRSQKHRQ
jgi:hypothetical protein